MLSEYQDYERRARTYSNDDIALFYSGRDPWQHPNSDWVGDLIAKWSTTNKHNVTLDGGSNGMNYFVSLGYKNWVMARALSTLEKESCWKPVAKRS